MMTNNMESPFLDVVKVTLSHKLSYQTNKQQRNEKMERDI